MIVARHAVPGAMKKCPVPAGRLNGSRLRLDANIISILRAKQAVERGFLHLFRARRLGPGVSTGWNLISAPFTSRNTREEKMTYCRSNFHRETIFL
jgi:hypothetical protein